MRLVAAAAALSGVFACRQVVGIHDDPPEALTTNACGLPHATSKCASCVLASCCSESSACASSAACAPYAGCVGACGGDVSCRSRCMIGNPVGNSSEVSALSACLAAKCENECGMACGALAGSLSPPSKAADCQICLTTNACTSAQACASSAECDAYSRCLLACPTADCRGACAGAHDAGAALFAPVYQDYSGICSTQCAYGSSWACVGRVSWPAARSQTVTLTIQVADYLNPAAPVPGVDVSVCLSCPCNNNVLAHGQTGTTGTVALQFPQVPDGAGHGLNGCVQLTSPNILPTLAYWGFPLSAPEASNTTPLGQTLVLTPAEQQAGLAAIGVTQDPARGQIGIQVLDCLGSPAPGVQVTTGINDPLVQIAYGTLSFTATSTDASGRVTLFNVPPGQLTLTATPIGPGTASSRVTVNVQAGTVTEVLMAPTP